MVRDIDKCENYFDLQLQTTILKNKNNIKYAKTKQKNFKAFPGIVVLSSYFGRRQVEIIKHLDLLLHSIYFKNMLKPPKQKIRCNKKQEQKIKEWDPLEMGFVIC